ncbi:alkaline-phosphatase-like protein [Schizothecium vesticola]|uniref:Alkaline-phosphatase-like protein n=1 Tax=Schizothecium vesticola TaxID=314040 RepID=A0AA40K7X3_9PEZI|nr:alkaline-phosphatase-like protein [Schizothecium vesticola]
MPLPINTSAAKPALTRRESSLLSPSDYDADAASIRSDQDTDSDDDERQLRARNSRELRAHDRLVLMEEEELDQLVTETRRAQDRGRRGSGLPVPIPNPLNLFVRRNSDLSPSTSRRPSPQPSASSTEDLALEKRSHRKARRKAKRDRLLADAQHGEDGELMYEMEEGGMKEGSSTGDSSDRDDSDEVDRQGLLGLAEAKTKRKRMCCRWLLIYAIIAVAFVILVLLAWKISIERRKRPFQDAARMVSNGTALFAPTTIIISLDGFRADFLDRGLTPRLNALVKEGVSPQYMLPSFPSVTFPNHFTLATGLYPEAHGIVGNTFWDPALKEEFYYTNASTSLDPKWWNGEPFWVTAQNSGLKTAIHMWPGSEAHVMHIEPTYLDRYKGNEKLANKVSRVLQFLDMPDHERPQVIAAYVPDVDSDGHRYGPNSTEIRTTISKTDDMLDQLFKGLEARHLADIVNVIVVSDHGMATTDVARLIQLEDIVDVSKIEHTDGWPLMGLRPKDPSQLQDIYNDIIDKTKSNPNVEVYLRDVNMPERYHFSRNQRIAPLWIVPKTGWALVKMGEMNLKEAQAKGTVYNPRGLHGYDHEHPLMRAIFIARGPAFPHQPNSRVSAFQNIEVYNILCDSVGISPAANNGTLRLPLKPVGLHQAPVDNPADPPDVHSLSSSPPPLPTTALAPEPTRSLVVDPVATGIDTPLAPSESPMSSSPPAQPTEAPQDGDTDEDGAKKGIKKVGEAISGFWDWFTGKVDKWWGKVKGGTPEPEPEPAPEPTR